ncbi:BT4734/BF3469 family protein [Bacteroides salyersiae]|uniref:BT4734/BF3469 family protein n=1 Tax=Bacteroides salyersiae TaxID=291644 RepID=UPI00207A4722|nr:BT4734/BF3469 family protein [Bacteroides salyersiae]
MEEIQILISSFKGFSKHTGKSKLTDKLLEIGSYTNGRIIEKIRALVRDGKKEEAALVKKQLKGSTLSATYKERRVPEMIDTYNDLQMMDLDGLSEEEMTNCRKLITGSPNTLFCFTSPSGNGLKVGVYMQDELSCRLRMELLRRSEISYEALETYHKQMFAYAKEYYETLCSVEVDASGSDIGRLFFTSYDPDIYICEEALRQVRQPQLTILPPPAKGKKKTVRQLMKEEMPGDESIDHTHIDPWIQMEFQSCVRSVERQEKYQPGNRNNFIFTLGNKCYRKNLPEEVAAVLAQKQFGAPDLDAASIVRNAYHYTTRTDHQEEEKKKPVAVRIIEFMTQQYEVWKIQCKLPPKTKRFCPPLKHSTMPP